MSNAKPMNGRRAWRKWLRSQRRKDKTSWAADIGTCRGRAAYARRHRGTNAGQGIPLLPLPLHDLCAGCADCQPAMGMYGFYNGGDPRRFTPDEECSTEAERELHRQHCEAWEKGERPTVKVSGIEWTEAMQLDLLPEVGAQLARLGSLAEQRAALLLRLPGYLSPALRSLRVLDAGQGAGLRSYLWVKAGQA